MWINRLKMYNSVIHYVFVQKYYVLLIDHSLLKSFVLQQACTGAFGTNCSDEPCKEGYYRVGCQSKCNCSTLRQHCSGRFNGCTNLTAGEAVKWNFFLISTNCFLHLLHYLFCPCIKFTFEIVSFKHAVWGTYKGNQLGSRCSINSI